MKAKFVNENIKDLLTPKVINPFEYLEHLIDNEIDIESFYMKPLSNNKIEFSGISISPLSGYGGGGKQYSSFEGTIVHEEKKFKVHIKGTEYYDDSVNYNEDEEEFYDEEDESEYPSNLDSEPEVIDSFDFTHEFNDISKIVDLLKDLSQ